MAWISVHEQVEGMKLRELSKAIGCSQKEALGVLVSLWLWGINNADSEGVLKSADKSDIIEALSVGLSTGLSPKKIVECLIEKHWIDEDNGVFILHDWDIWQEQWYKALSRRTYDAKRKREERKKINIECPQDCPPENPVQPSPSPSPSPNNIEVSNDTSCKLQSPPYQKIMDLFHEICKSLPKIKTVTASRQDTIRVWWKSRITIDDFNELFTLTEQSDFLSGRSGKWNGCCFDWIIKPANRQKILEGNYNNKYQQSQTGTNNLSPADQAREIIRRERENDGR